MKKSLLISLILVFSIYSFATINASPCTLDVSLLNQDPYPAIPGDYVEVVFQIDGLANPECGTVYFELLEKYPISFDPNTNPVVTINSGTYKKDYSSFLMAPYTVRVDEEALDGDNPIEVQYKYGNNEAYETQQFNLDVEDTRANFEVYVKSYDPSTNDLTLEILNTAKVDVEALTIEIPEQENIQIVGANTNIVGNLDSNEYTTADFTAKPKQGNITLNILYTDKINVRRTIEKTITFDPQYFKTETKSTPAYIYLIWIIVIVAIIYFFYRRHKKKVIRQQAAHHKN